jgi:hypothetical protein
MSLMTRSGSGRAESSEVKWPIPRTKQVLWTEDFGERETSERDPEDKESFERVAADEEIAFRDVESTDTELEVVRRGKRVQALLSMFNV